MRKVYAVGRRTNNDPDWEMINNEMHQAARTVYEDDLQPVDTGLLDHRGDPIIYYYERERIGFITE